MSRMQVQGYVAPGFEPVADALADVVAGAQARGTTGSAVAAWHDGRWVVDVWGGWADAALSRPWQRQSLVMPYSVTKPFAAVAVLLLADRGVVDLDAPLATYWPGFASPATVRQVLAHTAGHVVLDEPAPEAAFYDWELMCRLLAHQQPVWPSGEGIGESALFYGHLLGQVVRAVDGRSLGSFVADEVCRPHALDFHIGVPERDLGRVVDLTGFDDDFRRRGAERQGLMAAALANPPGALDPSVVNSSAWRTAEIPAVNGHGTARAVAGLYVALAAGDLLSPAMTAQLTGTAAAGYDRVLGEDARWGLGVALDDDGWGMGGVGGSFGWWSDAGRYAFGFVTGDIADHDRGGRVENALRGVLGLPPV